MEFVQLTYVCAIAKERNFTKAAESLFVSQSAISQSMSMLEKEIGTPLFVRSSKGVDLTKAGKKLHDYAVATLRERDSIVQFLSSSGCATGNISINCRTAFNTVLQLVYDFQLQYPNVDINMVSNPQSVPDLIISNFKPKPDMYVSSALKTEPFFLLLREDHPLAASESIELSSLSDEMLILDSNFEINRVFLQKYLVTGFKPAKVKVSPECYLIPKMVLIYNACASVLEGTTIDLPKGVVVRPFADEISRTIWVGLLKNKYQSNATALFHQYVLDKFVAVDTELCSYN